MQRSTLVNMMSNLTMLIKDSPYRLLSPAEASYIPMLTQGEFEARAMSFIKDPESGIPEGELAEMLTKAILAKMYRRALSENTLNHYLEPLYKLEPSLRPKPKRPK